MCCYKCEKKVPGCHGTCADYAAYVAWREEIKGERMAETMTRSVKIDNIMKTRRKNKW